MRSASVYCHAHYVGMIIENEDSFEFRYDASYLSLPDAEPISLTLPLRPEAYHSKILFPFFDGLIPEGWLLDIAVSNWKLNPRDRFGLLLSLCADCIGCVSVKPNESK